MRQCSSTRLLLRIYSLLVFSTCTGTALAQGDKEAGELLPPLPIEETGTVLSLPESYPSSWIMVDEASFFNHFGGKVIIMDALEAEHAKQIKGMIHKNLLGNFTQHKKRSEFYVLETFHERAGRGPRTDVLAIYDRSTLKIKKEIFWPTERLQALPARYSMMVTGDDQLLVAANLNPATSFTVVDLDTYEITETISTPGCVLTFPTGERSVSSLCSDGAMMTTVLDEKGHLKSQGRIDSFFDTDKTAIFERAAILDGIAYFPSFRGTMHTINLQGEMAEYVEEWSLVSEEQQEQNWRPSGLGLIGEDDQGLVYIIFQENGAEGTQTHGGSQVWVFDVESKERVKVIELPSHGLTLTLTHGEEPQLVVTNGEMNLDVFDAKSGEYIQTLSDFGGQTPLLLHESY